MYSSLHDQLAFAKYEEEIRKAKIEWEELKKKEHEPFCYLEINSTIIPAINTGVNCSKSLINSFEISQ